MYPKSGFKIVTGIQFLNGLALLDAKRLSFRAFRVYIAAFAIVAIREAAKRSRKDKGGSGSGRTQTYRHSEIATLCGATVRQVQCDLKRLSGEGLLSFSEREIVVSRAPIKEAQPLQSLVRSPTRPIPVPRAVLRFLAGEKKQSVGKTMIAYMLRGLALSRKGAQVTGKGSVKNSWISQIAGLSERGARDGKRELIRLGWIGRDTGSAQWKLNRNGSYFSINLDLDLKTNHKPLGPSRSASFAAPTLLKAAEFAAPYKDRKTPNGSKNQKSDSGVLKTGSGGEEKCAMLSDVLPQDLCRLSRCEELYWQAVEKNLIRQSDSSALNFLAAAVRARSTNARDPVRVFMAIVKQGLWNHITCEQEERARLGLVRTWAEDPARFRVRPDLKNGTR